MPGREIPLISGQVYHVINRGVAHQPIFSTKQDHQRALDTIIYYQWRKPPLRFSFLKRLSNEQKNDLFSSIKKEDNLLVEIIAYCLMPNHLHLILKQLKEGGISDFMSNVSNSYTRYFNTRQERVGPLLQGKFKAIRVETDWQLLHLSRYIHLNPYTSFVVKTIDKLTTYPYSSLPEYLAPGKESDLCRKNLILNNFKNIDSYKKFILDQADYQRELEKIKHLVME